MERCDAGLSFWIVGSEVHENANAPHPLGRRLRSERERPWGSRAAERRDELAPFQLSELHSSPSQSTPGSMPDAASVCERCRPCAYATMKLLCHGCKFGVSNSIIDHSITSSASDSRLSEMLIPSVFAVFMLMISSNLVTCCTGSSAGFAPFRIFAVYTPTCRYTSTKLRP